MDCMNNIHYSKHAFIAAGPATWNQLSSTIHNASSLNCFKTALKIFLFTAGDG